MRIEDINDFRIKELVILLHEHLNLSDDQIAKIYIAELKALVNEDA